MREAGAVNLEPAPPPFRPNKNIQYLQSIIIIENQPDLAAPLLALPPTAVCVASAMISVACANARAGGTNCV